ncbi:MAG: phosphoglycolate phosphatase [Gammaproteobacteria bacterium]|nr:phosphoglycolate phosphatase [Gammaproteobacteria bacterium]MBU1646752.1 phosphoglycolate phosphatase [Gammaproteobacteria bacterium]MBU1971786.1 phosphoglycolate phosphatase [Gammaproteobacteria bacterium]
MPEAVFFDLDGTLADTAPDLAGALNKLLAEHGRTALPQAVLRPHVSAGARGLLRVGFDIAPDDTAYPALHKRFIELYEDVLCEATTLFPGIDALLDSLDAQGIVWGVVTNKPERLTLPLMEALGLTKRAAAIVGGDTTARSKPDPLPLIHACSVAGVAANASMYLGDDLRDIQAGAAAGMCTVAVTWGYLGDGPAIDQWGADITIDAPEALLAAMHQGNC